MNRIFKTQRNRHRCFLLVGAALIWLATGGCSIDIDNTDNTDNTNDSSGTDDTASESATKEFACEDIEWATKESYVVNGGTVARWQQTAFADVNGDGQIGEAEREDVEIDLLDLCEGGKSSLTLLIGSDD